MTRLFFWFHLFFFLSLLHFFLLSRTTDKKKWNSTGISEQSFDYLLFILPISSPTHLSSWHEKDGDLLQSSC